MSERTVVIASRSLPLVTALRKSVMRTSHFARHAKNVTELLAVMERKPFSTLIADRPFYKDLSSAHPDIPLGYLTLMVERKDLGHTLSLQASRKIRDWILFPFEDPQVASLLARGKIFLHQASELANIRETATSTIRTDAPLLCTGKWAEEANAWINRVKDRREPLLLVGEAGSGKHLLARLIHFSSQNGHALVALVRCQSREEENLEKELFGLKSPLAFHGSVFLDKVEQLSKRLQRRLATALRCGYFASAGDSENIPLRARLIFSVQESGPTASISSLLQRDLAQILRRHMLRIPPLKERTSDIPLIVKAVLEKIKRRQGARPEGISDRAMELLTQYTWPGNVRELEGVLWAASVLAQKNRISMRYITPFLSNGHSAVSDEEKAIEEVMNDRLSALFRRFGVEHLKDLHTLILGKVERALIGRVLEQCGNSQVKAAHVLGINRNTLRRKMVDYRIN